MTSEARVHEALQTHFYLKYYKDRAFHEMGVLVELETVVKIISSEVVNACFDSQGIPIRYPSLEKRQSLVLCVQGSNLITVCGVYTFETMVNAAKIASTSGMTVQWRVMEIPENIYKGLYDRFKNIR